MRCKRLPGFVSLLLALAWGASSGSVEAATATTTFLVTANINALCSINATDMNFGDYTGVKINTQSQITVKCTNTTQWAISLNSGTYPGATPNSRRMTGPAGAFLNYQISPDASQGYSWGDTPPINTISGTGSGATQLVTAYGVLFAGQNTAAPGGYVDTLTATITF